uniref:Uncharacterized protein n=1 Tax=Ananas comosus var. bracteatus TaxID=296719 RepID=A0A6V7QBT8_ANACO|nr:unnamed protein product [Ananas comosus var. bracteatus]
MASMVALKSVVSKAMEAEPSVPTALQRLKAKISLILVMCWFTFFQVISMTTAATRNVRSRGGGGDAAVGLRRETSRSRLGVGWLEKLSSCVRNKARNRVGKDKKILKRISWADEVGGELLKVYSSKDEDEVTLTASGKSTYQEHKEVFTAKQQRSISFGAPSTVKMKMR